MRRGGLKAALGVYTQPMDKRKSSHVKPLQAFLRGVGSLLDIVGSRDRQRREAIRATTAEAAWRQDWEMLGQDFWKTLESFDSAAQRRLEN